MKKSSDQIIDQTLTGLRHTQPRNGMQQRLLRALNEQHALRPTRFVWTWPRAAAATAMLLASLLITSRHHTTPSTIASNTPPSTPPTELSSRPEPQHSEGSVKRPASPVGATTNVHPATTTHEPTTTAPQPIVPGDALAELRAPSQPAPELPLTEQEQLMLRIMHHGDPVQLAQLDPAHRAAEREADRKQFQDFFTKPTQGENQ